MASKRPLMGFDGPAPVVGRLAQFCIERNSAILSGTTFRYIHMYMIDSFTPDENDMFQARMFGLSEAQILQKMRQRLTIACEDFSYSLEELDFLKSQGKSSYEIANEICNRV
jgi:hypothetical protein